MEAGWQGKYRARKNRASPNAGESAALFAEGSGYVSKRESLLLAESGRLGGRHEGARGLRAL